jgi:hypothetical protein
LQETERRISAGVAGEEEGGLMELAELREQAMLRDKGRCAWTGCGIRDRLEMAHLHHRGMGGSDEANRLENVAMLCAGPGTPDHHGILDGRTVAGRRREVALLLGQVLDDRTYIGRLLKGREA